MESIPVNCEIVQGGNLAERYVLGQLAEPGRTAFEEHYYLCDRCLNEVRLLQALQAAAPAVPVRRKAAFGNWTWAAIAAALVAAACLAALPLLRQQPVASTPMAVANPPAGAADGYAAAVHLLAQTEAPRYLPSRLRGAPASREDAFRAAMEPYTRGDYGAAADALRPLAEPSPDAVAAAFFLGICLLMTGNAEAAAQQLRAVEIQGDTPYLEPARFYLAKALLASSDLDGAAKTLQQTIGMKGDREADARQLLERIRALPRRP